ncbi:hypothetical protein SD71_03250 [Cohnella kolymensis]|uniref:Uncharacterized protein n=1 Tax=Cohnella kolymensis TaxID=1590652 RepID=A0ABR5A9E7_9BACL|nr:hypothetical protein [Cohnella kolymensis]KIL37629.1 hypothetical protein SD71_03250 [Cohnella kolymensis]
MYKKVVTPKKITQQWLDRAFAPLRNYLNSHHPEHAERIIGLIMFMANQDDRFFYKHRVTKGYIVFDQAGQLVSCDESALEYEFDWMSEMPAIRPFEERFIHPNVSGWVRDNLRKKDTETYGEEVSIFLQELWGPTVNYDFTNLAVGCPPRNGSHLYEGSFGAVVESCALI